MIWKKPHIEKIYEALTAIAEGRIEKHGKTAKCFTSNNNKFYDIKYDPIIGSINSNDNEAYYTHSLSYPMIAYLMLTKKIPFERELLEILRDIDWDSINQNFKNDYDKSIRFVLGELKKNGDDVEFIKKEVKKIYDFTCGMNIKTLGEIQKPARNY